MTIIKQIGRYEIPITGIAFIKKRAGFWAFFFPGYDVVLNSGVRLRLNEEEKRQLDSEREIHANIMQVWGMCKSAGLRA